MIIVNKSEGVKIEDGEKIASLRPIRENGKGYLRLGSIQQIRDSRNFKVPPVCRVLIYKKDFVNIGELSQEDFYLLGYNSKDEYMEQSYNKRNPSLERVRYEFIELSQLVDFAQSLEITPKNFYFLWDFVKYNEDLRAGVNPSLIYEGCDILDLESEFSTLQTNIEELL